MSSHGEWHVLPARMITEVLRLRGVAVTSFGPSVPVDDLVASLESDPPGAVAVASAMPMSLVGTWHTISALRALGTTIVCGGAGRPSR